MNDLHNIEESPPNPPKRIRLEGVFNEDAVGYFPLSSLSDLLHTSYTMHLVRSDLGHGSEKIVLYRSDRKAAIGKISFIRRYQGDARIVVLNVKKEFRGKDLGGLLFAECVQSLRCYGDGRVLLDAEEGTTN